MIKYNGEMYEGNYEPIITTELFEEVQERLNENSRPRKSKHAHNFLFTELFRCGECGSMITAQYAKGNGGIYAYYRCTKKKGYCGQSYLRDDLMLDELRKAKLWVEPLRDWLELAYNAGKIAFSDDLFEIKSFLDKVGTNRYLKDRKVAVDFIRSNYIYNPVFQLYILYYSSNFKLRSS